MSADAIGHLGDLVSFEQVVKQLNPDFNAASWEDDYEYVAEKLALLREFQGIPAGCDFGVQKNRIALVGYEFGPLDYHLFERHDLEAMWILNANWADAPVVGLHGASLEEYEAFNRPVFLGAFLEHLLRQGFHSELHRDWIYLLSDEFLLGAVRPKVVRGVSYFVTLPIEIVQTHGFVDSYDSPIKGWWPYLGGLKLGGGNGRHAA